jgi:hypothetical protein
VAAREFNWRWLRGDIFMRDWMSQIVIGIIVTVVGTVIAHAIISSKGGKSFFGGGHYGGPARSGR